MGIDLDSGNSVYWDLNEAFAPHALVIGPSGSGKTLTLSILAYRMLKSFNTTIVVFDIKDEYKDRLSKDLNIDVMDIDPFKNPLPICICNEYNPVKMNRFSHTISKIYGLSEGSRKILLDLLESSCRYCTPLERIVNSIEIQEKNLILALNDIIQTFAIYDTIPSIFHRANRASATIINLKRVFLQSKELSSTIIIYILTNILYNVEPRRTHIPSKAIILDEIWHTIPYISSDLISMLSRYARSFGISLLMASQSIDDLQPYIDTIVGNCSLFIALASHSYSYWHKVSRYLNLSSKLIEKALELKEKGEGVARIVPKRKPYFIYIDPIE